MYITTKNWKILLPTKIPYFAQLCCTLIIYDTIFSEGLRLELTNMVFPHFCFPLSDGFGTEVQQYFEVNSVQRTRNLGRHWVKPKSTERSITVFFTGQDTHFTEWASFIVHNPSSCVNNDEGSTLGIVGSGEGGVSPQTFIINSNPICGLGPRDKGCRGGVYHYNAEEKSTCSVSRLKSGRNLSNGRAHNIVKKEDIMHTRAM